MYNRNGNGEKKMAVPSYVNVGTIRQDEEYGKRKRGDAERMATRKRGRRVKKKKGLRIFLSVMMVLLSAFIGCAMATVQWAKGTLDLMNRDVRSLLEDVDVSGIDLMSNGDITNILLVGSDKRATWKEEGRSDTLMIATLDQKHKKLKLSSLMRDMYVSIPGHGEDKLNAAYSLGGVPLVYETVARNFQVKIDAYVVVDFKAFKSIIDAIGGVDIELTDAEHDYLTTAYKKGSVLKLKKGMNKMNGAQALAYTRIRQDAQNDFGRTQRQRNVIQSIFTNIKTMPKSKWTALAKDVLPHITTDIKNEAIFDYMLAIIRMGTTEIEQFRIPMDDAYHNETIGNQQVLIPDLDENKRELHRFIFEE